MTVTEVNVIDGLALFDRIRVLCNVVSDSDPVLIFKGQECVTGFLFLGFQYLSKKSELCLFS